MTNIKILDCTLRDGGYINDWNFGYDNIKSMIARLTKSKIDIVECGFLEDSNYNKECSFFSNVDEIKKILPEDSGDVQYVAMTRYGYLNIDHLKEYDGKSINGIRVTFHEEEAEEAIEYCRQIQEKGYKVYVQPVGTTSYTDSFLLKIIEIVNKIKPFAFYIVDTLGLMRKNDLLRMFYLIDNNLQKDIVVGFHSHNNLQLSFSNAQELADLHTKRSIIIDSSVYGMGRGAGNLNTELIAQHLNSVKDKDYSADYLLEIIDDTINPILEKHSWGYSVPYYLAAINNCHPNYATYLMNRKTLQVKAISNILNTITLDKRELYDEKYILELYSLYQKHNIDDHNDLEALSEEFKGKRVLVLAPGASIREQYEEIKQYLTFNEVKIISVNFSGDEIKPDFYFFSNDKRFQKSKESLVDKENRAIISSNVEGNTEYYKYKINYSDYLNSQPLVNDNATLMLFALLIKLKVKQIDIAGFDGFIYNANDNYAIETLETHLEESVVLELNAQIANVVRDFEQKVRLNFITDSLYNPVLV
ncbi:aldolase catalytic domain-containing protein [Paenibacillus sacheonensis]|uniref:4-hydroxy-2-ketovalerate aldolase n=1 Tax=Paenibacillus sacheonensis TaxID=742054 RepID=A0A7X5C5B0_9BACL|nr:aldolase catalytic domain-containing protein [Paenibacillus sacheonensis]MBM7567982.1 4-hydroxy 2-oxovalerate aldolase [Paenibacillus sacheonensis]NBC73189.1 4-hydroxy-2-ketovalerate aldolase [Paenibacillus sacheonensis]